MRTRIGLLVFLSVLAGVPTAQAALQLEFVEPGWLEGDIELPNASWLLARLEEGEEIQIHVLEAARLVNTTWNYAQVNGANFGQDLPPSKDSSEADVSPMVLTLRAAAGMATMGMRITDGGLTLGGRSDLMVLDSREELADRIREDSINWAWSPWMTSLSLDGGVSALLVPDSSNRLDFADTQAGAVEWFNMEVVCHGVVSVCPGGGGSDVMTYGAASTSVQRAAYHFVRIDGPMSIVAASGVMQVAAGAPALDAIVAGALHLPLADSESCKGCPPIEDQTLAMTGSMELSGIRPTEGGFSATLSGDFTSARVNEQWVSPDQLGFYGTAAAATAGIALIIKFLLAPLFTRLSKSQALEHPRRKAIYEYVAHHPGANFREVARRTGIAAGTVRHHLTILERSGHLVERAHNGTVRLFENHGKFDHNWSDLVLLREPPLQAVHDWLKAHPQSPQKDILEALEQVGWSRSTTQHRLVRLVEGGLVTIRLQGRLKIYSVVDRIAPKPTLASILGIHTPAMAS